MYENIENSEQIFIFKVWKSNIINKCAHICGRVQVRKGFGVCCVATGIKDRVKDLDIRILNLLIENSKLSYRKIAQRLGVSTATVMSHVNSLEKSGIVRKYSALLDHEKLGYDVSVVIDVRVSKGKLFEVEKRIAGHPNVRAVFDTTGSFDSLILADFRSRHELDSFLKKIQAYDFVERTETRLILNRVKDEHIKIS